MDLLSDVLSLLKPRSYMAGGFDMAGDWSLQIPRHEGIKCYAVVSGQCWLVVEGVADPMQLQAGDCLLLPGGRPFRLTNDLSLPPVDIYAMFPLPLNGGIATVNGGGDALGVGGFFSLTGRYADLLLDVLPPVVHIQKGSDKAVLRWAVEQMRQELREPQPGGPLVVEYLAQMILIQALRLYLANGLKEGVGWLFALADKQMSLAINAMHNNPAHRWTVQELSEQVGMSRSTFALRFKERVGTSPLAYLTHWRMLLGGDRLTNTNDPVSVIAQSLGYESESAFCTAFKRNMGCSPRQYSRRHPVGSPLYWQGTAVSGG